MQKQKFDEIVSYFNKKLSEMEIETKYKMELLGMVTALGHAHEKEMHEERIQNNAVHLCDSCQYTYVTCPSHDNDAIFGDGKGNDNICACNKYRPISAQQEQQHGRIFQGIVVEYPEYCTYPEYKGKPYFSIKYTENGQKFIGYGTYKPEVLSEFLKEYFMTSAQPESDKEQLSRLIRTGIIATNTKDVYSCGMRNGMRWCRSLLDDKEPKFEDASQYAQPERKKGKWIDAVLPNDSGGLQVQVCDQCNTFYPLAYTGGGHNFCPNCGADMREETK